MEAGAALRQMKPDERVCIDVEPGQREKIDRIARVRGAVVESEAAIGEDGVRLVLKKAK